MPLGIRDGQTGKLAASRQTPSSVFLEWEERERETERERPGR